MTSFKDYEALYRRFFQNPDTREIAEAWKRGATAEADGIEVIVCLPDEIPPYRDQCDVTLSAAFGSQRFVMYARSEDVDLLEAMWEKWYVKFAGDRRRHGYVVSNIILEAQKFIHIELMTNGAYEDGKAFAIASPIIWLARNTSRGGRAIGQHIHLEITEVAKPDGRTMWNYEFRDGFPTA